MLEPDKRLWDLLGAEHQFGVWVGKELLPIWKRIAELGGDEYDYELYVRPSNLWRSYEQTTSDHQSKREASFYQPLKKSFGAFSAGWDVEEALTAVADRVRAFNGWPNPRTASRDRAVALAFLTFCIEQNAYTKTVSSYELAKHVPELSRKSVERGLKALVALGLLAVVGRTDIGRVGKRTTVCYRVVLHWKSHLPASRAADVSPNQVSPDDLINSCQRLIRSGQDTSSDTWARSGLGLTARRIYEALSDEPLSVKELVERLGMSRSPVVTHLGRLFEVGLAGFKHEGRAKLWFRGEAPLDAVAEVLGATGQLARNVEKMEILQADQRWLNSLPYGERQAEFKRRKDASLRRRHEAAAVKAAAEPEPEPVADPSPVSVSWEETCQMLDELMGCAPVAPPARDPFEAAPYDDPDADPGRPEGLWGLVPTRRGRDTAPLGPDWG